MPMDWSNPYTELRRLVATAITDYAPIVAAVGGPGNIQVFDQAVDPRGDMQNAKQIDCRAQLNPEDGNINFEDSSSSAAITRTFSIEIRKSGKSPEPVEWFEWQIHKAMCYLYHGRAPGSLLTILMAEWPLTLVAIKATSNDREFLPVNNPEEWNTVCMVVVHAEVSFEDLMTEE